MESMTGYGESHFTIEGFKFAFYLKSLNSKYFEVSYHFPDTFRWFEFRADELIKKRINRGKVDIFLDVESTQPSQNVINLPLLNSYEQIFQNLYNRKKVSIPMEVLVQLPDIFEAKDIAWSQYLQKFEFYYLRAMAKLKRARIKEGKKIRSILIRKIRDISRYNKKNSIIQKRDLKEQETVFSEKLSYLIESNKELLEKRLNTNPSDFLHLLWNIARDDFRYFIQSDATEEIDRIHIHLDEATLKVDMKEPQGKILEFFFQEILREVNTVASKTRNIDMNRNAVYMKTSIEEIREQLRNIE